MNRIIRWQGFALLAGLVTLVLVFFTFLAEPLLKNQLIQVAEQQNKAEVNINKLELHYFPFGLSLQGVQVTNYKLPSENLIEFEQLTAKVDLWQYWQGKKVIDELSVESLRFDQKRAQLGKLVDKPKDNKTDEKPKQPQSQSSDAKDKSSEETKLPAVENVLSDSNLLTVKNSEKLQQGYREEKVKLEQVKADLPNKNALKQYEQKIKALSKKKIKSLDDLKALKKEFSALKKQFKQDKKAISAAKKQLAGSKKRLQPLVKALKDSPEQDWQQIEQKYQSGDTGKAQVAGLIFGDKAGDYSAYIEKAYQYLKPFIKNSDKDKTQNESSTSQTAQRFVHFELENTLPEFLLRKALIEVLSPQGDYRVEVSDLTHQHWLTKQNSSIVITSSNAGSIEHQESRDQKQAQHVSQVKNGLVNINYNFVMNKAGDFNGQGQWHIENYPIKHSKLVSKDDFSLVLDSGLLFGNGKLENINAELTNNNHFDLKATQYSGTTDSSLQRSILSVLQKTEQLSADVKVYDQIDSPKFKISSTIDDIFKDALVHEGKAKLAKFKSKVQAGLQEKLTESLDINNQELQQLVDLEQSLNDSDKLLDQLIDNDVVKEKGDKLKKKLKNKLEGKLKKLF